MSTTAEKFSFKPMLAVVLSGETLDVQWLNEHGVGALRASQLAQAGWLTHLGRGAYTLHGDTLKREKCLALPCLALLMRRHPGLHVGGKTALLWRGRRHNVTVRETITLWDEQRALLPSWFTDRLESVYQTTPLFDAQMPSDDDLQPWPGGRPEVVVSVPERALLELLRDVGKTETLQDSRNSWSACTTSTCPCSTSVLAHATRIKVLRLTRSLSEKLGLPWAQVARTHSESMGGGHGDA
jgi:hypothetical protein